MPAPEIHPDGNGTPRGYVIPDGAAPAAAPGGGGNHELQRRPRGRARQDQRINQPGLLHSQHPTSP